MPCYHNRADRTLNQRRSHVSGRLVWLMANDLVVVGHAYANKCSVGTPAIGEAITTSSIPIFLFTSSLFLINTFGDQIQYKQRSNSHYQCHLLNQGMSQQTSCSLPTTKSTTSQLQNEFTSTDRHFSTSCLIIEECSRSFQFFHFHLIEAGEEGAVIITNLKTFISHQILLLLHNQIDQIKKKNRFNCVRQVIGSVEFIEFTLGGGLRKRFFIGTEPA